MGLGQTIIYIVVPVVVVIYLLISDTTGLNFSLKVNFIANFMAPLLAYTAISTLGLAYTFTDTKNTMLEFGLIGALTFLITYPYKLEVDYRPLPTSVPLGNKR